jgi:hypothetical protein
MKNFILRKIFAKKGYFDREFVCSVSQGGAIRYLVKKIYRKILTVKKPKKTLKVNDLERIGYCFQPISFKSKFKNFFRKKRNFKSLKTIQQIF